MASPPADHLSTSASTRSIRRLILTRFGLVATVPLITVALIHGAILTRRNRRAVENELSSVAQSVAQRVASHLTQHEQAITALAGLIETNGDLAPAQLTSSLAVTHRTYPGFLTLLAADRTGRLLTTQPVRNAAGELIVAGNPSVADRDYFRTPLAHNRPFVSPAFRGRGFGTDPIVALSAPVHDATGAVAAIVEGSLDLALLSKLCSRADLPASLEFVVLDAEHHVVFSNRPDRFPALSIPAAPHFRPALGPDAPPSTVTEIAATAQDPAAKLLARADFAVSTAAPRWSVFVLQDTAVALEETDSYWRRTALAAVLAALVAYFISRRVAARLTAPIEALASSIGEFSLGAPVSRQPPRAIGLIDETNRLWSGFLDMANRLDRTYTQLAQSQSELRHANNRLETEVTQRTAELVAYRDRLDLALEASNTCTWDNDLAQNRLYIDARWSRMLGAPEQPSEMPGNVIFRIVHPADLAPVIRQVRLCLNGPTSTFRSEHRVRNHRGEWIWILSAGRVIARDADGRATRVIGTNTDITARRVAEAEVASIRERLELALDAANTCTWDNDFTTDRLTLDARWSVMLGGEPRPVETTARRLLASVHPEDRQAALATRRRLDHSNDTDYDVEQRVRTARGDWLWIKSVGRVLGRDSRGFVTRIIGTNTDITVRKQAELQLLRQKEFLTTLQRTTLDLLDRRELNDVFQSLIEHATSLLRAPIGELLLKEGEELVLSAHTHDATFAGPYRIGRGHAPLSWRALDSGRPVVLANYAKSPDRRAYPEVAATTAVAVIPILHGNASVGAISLGRTKPGDIFTDDDLAQCTHLAQMAALVLHNARIRETALREAADRSAALRESEARARALFDSSPVSIALLTVPEGRLVDLNAAALRTFGYTREEASGRTTLELNLWADEAQRDHLLAELRAKGHLSGSEVRLRRKDGSVFHCLYSSTVVTLGGQLYSLNTVQDVSDLKQAEQALRESEVRFRAVFDQSPLIIALASISDGRIVEVNSAAVAAFGATREEILGRSSAELHLWVDPTAQERYRQLLQTHGVVTSFETDLQRKNGETFTALFSGRILTIDGHPYSLNSIQDISARKRSEAERDRTLALMQATLESTADGILVVNADGHIDTYNRVFAEMWRLDSASSVQPPDAERVILAILGQLADPERFLLSLRDLYSGSEDEVFDTLTCIDGRIFERYSHPQFIANRPTGRVWSFRDITERHHAESALRASEERFRVLADVSPVGIYSTDPAGRCTFVNRRWCEIAGLSLEQALGDGWQVALHPDDREKVTRRRTIAQKNDGAPPAEFRFVRPDGTVTWLVGQFRAQHDTGGTIVGYVGTITDISTLKHAEAEREKMEVQVRQAQKMDSLGTLAGGIAHDFNNILTGILGFTDLARLSLTPGHAAHECLDHVLRSGQRARELVRQILTFSRSSHSERTRHQLHHEVAEALQLLRSTLPAMVELEKNIDLRTPPVLADATQVHQIVMNLCTNAWQALPPRGGRLTVSLESVTVTAAQASTHPDLAPGPYVRLSVADTGSGMSTATLEHIFEPFFTTKAVGKGTGLGLAVVHGIMKSNQGAITVQSSLGVGTTFHLYFPALVSAAPAAVLNDSGHIPRGHGERILFVDDDEASGHAIERLVASLGYQVVRFTSPVLALQLFAAQPAEFGLALLDLAMPDLPGDALAENLLALRPELPVVMLTGFVEPERQAAILASGVRQVLAKPPSIPELARAIAEHLTILPSAS